MYFQTLCRASITEAFYFSRAQGDLNHRALLEKLVAFVHSDSYGAIKATRGVELISLPLHEEEESWLEEYLEEGSGKALNGAMDTLIMRRIASGRLKSKPQERGMGSNRKIDGVNWSTLTGSI